MGLVVDKMLENSQALTKREAWDLIDEKIRVAEERKDAESPGSIENKGNKKSHFWTDFKVYFAMIVCTSLAILVVILKVKDNK